ncbi:MAG: DUF4389 domain-containing protein [Actinobacteria bacterium]|nr:DUF4389 domain-containing protein [Actinomycetota bacterium]
MNDRPARLVVSDDRGRSRLTVFFRLFLAIPHFVWLGLWTFAVFFTAIAQWFVTVVRARPADPLQTFHVAYIRYATHVGAYLALAANPFPGFLGEPGYPIDVELDAAERQPRLTAGSRFLLAIPAIFFLALVNGGGSAGSLGGSFAVSGGVVLTAAFLGWFACLALGEMPHGLRNVAAYGLRYTAETYAYVLLVTPTYPSTDPTLPASAGPPPEHPVALDLNDDRGRSRLTTFFRLFLTVPHMVWLLLWGIAVFFAVIGQWFFALASGRPAVPLHRFLAAYVRYQTHVGAFLFMVANPFPGFTGRPGYPVDVYVAPPERQSRWVTFFRFFLGLPAFILSGALSALLIASGIGGWFAALAIGRMPEGLRNAGAHALRYNAQVSAYATLLTDRYPFSGPPTLEPVEPIETPWAETPLTPVDAPA